MNSQRVFGAALLIVGVILLIAGMSASNSVADRLSDTFTGRFTQATMWYIIGGIGAALLGLFVILLGARGRNT